MVMPSTRVVWSIRNGRIDPADGDWLVRWSFKLECALSSFPDLIIANSEAGKTFCASNGFPAPKIRVISNGVDTKRFRPDPEKRAQVRAMWRTGEGEKVIGIVGRLHPEKDHATFVRAAALISGRRPGLRFVVIGEGPADYRDGLQRLAGELGVAQSFTWAGGMADMPAAYNALDLLASSSVTEGFSNVLCEAMACGVPCVATDVGDSARIVGDTGAVIPPGDAAALANAWDGLSGLPEQDLACLGRRARLRIETHCRRELLVEQTESVLDSLL
jgi:glycosyltransferase involved in cell wall biosynthesis